MCRVDGKDLDKLPHNRIRRSIESVLESQNKFPLDFANHLRGRLRRANFTIYKRGGKRWRLLLFVQLNVNIVLLIPVFLSPFRHFFSLLKTIRI